MCRKTRVTIRNERREMQRLMQERAMRNPVRQEPAWILDFWAERRRMLT
ncbi:hypothetical protein [Noviherbaspirillum aerium]|nr:hypothetical protein [Noviherbaspirillum aerium]